MIRLLLLTGILFLSGCDRFSEPNKSEILPVFSSNEKCVMDFLVKEEFDKYYATYKYTKVTVDIDSAQQVAGFLELDKLKKRKDIKPNINSLLFECYPQLREKGDFAKDSWSTFQMVIDLTAKGIGIEHLDKNEPLYIRLDPVKKNFVIYQDKWLITQ